jgi:hypothetical protein
MFFGKANDEKHYSKIAKRVMEIAPRYTAFVSRGQSSIDGVTKSSMEIKVFENYDRVGYRFWVNPFEGGWQNMWIYTQVIPKDIGDWVDTWGDAAKQVGDPNYWNGAYVYDQKAPFTYHNFAKTTAAFFFEPCGPL